MKIRTSRRDRAGADLLDPGARRGARFATARLYQIARPSALLLVALTSANLCNYAFHLVVSRLLGPSQYGALGALLGVLIWISVPLSAVQAVVAKEVAQRGGDERNTDALRRSTRGEWGMAWLAASLGVAIALASPALRDFLHFDSVWPIVLVALYLVPAAIASVSKGVLQGAMRFGSLAFVVALGALLRIVFGVVLVARGGGVAGAISASLVSEAVVMVAALALRSERPSLAAAWRPRWGLLRRVTPPVIGMGGLWLLIEEDLVLARHFLPHDVSGSYAAAGILARGVLFVPGAISIVALSYFAGASDRRSIGWLRTTSLLTAVVSVPAAATLWALRDWITAITFGGAFARADDLLPIMALGMVALALTNLQLSFHVAVGSRAYLLLWPLAAVEAGAIASVGGGSATTVAWIATISAWVVAAGGWLVAREVFRGAKSRAPLPAIPPWSNGAAPTLQLSLVMPVHNGGAQLTRRVDDALEVLSRLQRTSQLIVVSDGSTDASEVGLSRYATPVELVHYPERRGKGAALRVGALGSAGSLVAFVDGDGDLDLSYLRGFVDAMEREQADMVIGSKRHVDSAVQYPVTRRVMSFVYHSLVQALFGLNVSDTQTGMKLIRRDVLEAVLPHVVEQRFVFDLEMLVVARRLGFTKIVEAPIGLHYQFDSTISPAAIAQIVLDTLAVFWRRYIVCVYEPARSARAAGLGTRVVRSEGLPETTP